MVVRMGGMNIKGMYLIHSPKVKNIKLVSRGSGNFRSNIKHRWRKVGKDAVSRPRIRNRVMKKRVAGGVRIKSKKTYDMDYDTVQSDNVKRIIKL